MPLQVTCPSCGRVLPVRDDLIGRQVKCGECQTVFTVEAPGGRRDESEGYREGRPASSRPPPPEEPPRRDDRDDSDLDERERRSRRGRRRRSSGGRLSHRGGMVLTFGILSLVGGIFSLFAFCCFLFLFGPLLGFGFGIPSVVMGNGDLRRMSAGEMDSSGRGMTMGGFVCGIIGVVMSLIILVVYLVVFLVYGAAIFAGALGK